MPSLLSIYLMGVDFVKKKKNIRCAPRVFIQLLLRFWFKCVVLVYGITTNILPDLEVSKSVLFFTRLVSLTFFTIYRIKYHTEYNCLYVVHSPIGYNLKLEVGFVMFFLIIIYVFIENLPH